MGLSIMMGQTTDGVTMMMSIVMMGIRTMEMGANHSVNMSFVVMVLSIVMGLTMML